MERLVGTIVHLVILKELYKRPPIRGYLFYFPKGDMYGVVTGNGYTQPIRTEPLAIYENFIVLGDIK